MYGYLYRLEITTLAPAWEFPCDRFVEYGPEDERWARLLGFGREVRRETRVVIPASMIIDSNPGEITFKVVEPITETTADWWKGGE